VAELATETALSSAMVEESRSADSVDALEGPLEDPAAPDPLVSALEHERVTILHRAVAELNDGKRSVVCRRYGLGRPEQPVGDIAADLHLSPHRTRVFEGEALCELRDSLEREGLTA
jgi:DNA-directed RNA polymerase sigma subunit (sigma70/sigma32)